MKPILVVCISVLSFCVGCFVGDFFSQTTVIAIGGEGATSKSGKGGEGGTAMVHGQGSMAIGGRGGDAR